eukprot:GHVL01007027.1.p1 GENE.GHVL01007027.1~~GHVL01007027.1.p1  ORF type:complete len:793 (-),score=273.91 GHVL01007027.1:450-2510(-)
MRQFRPVKKNNGFANGGIFSFFNILFFKKSKNQNLKNLILSSLVEDMFSTCIAQLFCLYKEKSILCKNFLNSLFAPPPLWSTPPPAGSSQSNDVTVISPNWLLQNFTRTIFEIDPWGVFMGHFYWNSLQIESKRLHNKRHTIFRSQSLVSTSSHSRTPILRNGLPPRASVIHSSSPRASTTNSSPPRASTTHSSPVPPRRGATVYLSSVRATTAPSLPPRASVTHSSSPGASTTHHSPPWASVTHHSPPRASTTHSSPPRASTTHSFPPRVSRNNSSHGDPPPPINTSIYQSNEDIIYYDIINNFLLFIYKIKKIINKLEIPLILINNLLNKNKENNNKDNIFNSNLFFNKKIKIEPVIPFLNLERSPRGGLVGGPGGHPVGGLGGGNIGGPGGGNILKKRQLQQSTLNIITINDISFVFYPIKNNYLRRIMTVNFQPIINEDNFMINNIKKNEYINSEIRIFQKWKNDKKKIFSAVSAVSSDINNNNEDIFEKNKKITAISNEEIYYLLLLDETVTTCLNIKEFTKPLKKFKNRQLLQKLIEGETDLLAALYFLYLRTELVESIIGNNLLACCYWLTKLLVFPSHRKITLPSLFSVLDNISINNTIIYPTVSSALNHSISRSLCNCPISVSKRSKFRELVNRLDRTSKLLGLKENLMSQSCSIYDISENIKRSSVSSIRYIKNFL